MSQKSCSATGPASRHSSKQGEEAKKETQSPGDCVSFLCAVCFDPLSLAPYPLHFTFRALPPLRYRSTPDSSSLRLLHFTFRASFLCAVSFGALSLRFAFRALPPLRYRSTPDSSSLRLLHFTFHASFSVLCRLAPCLLHFVSQFLTFHIAPRVGHFLNRPFLNIIAFAATHLPCRLYKIMSIFHCEIRLCLFRAFDSPPGCARPSSGQGPIFL